MDYKLYHLSHTDLDGYGCQMVTRRYFDSVTFYNSNYGREINERFNQIFADIQNDGFEKNIILITDLNLTPEQAKEFDSKIMNTQENIMILLLDHHKSGQDCAQEFDWYYLDDTRCATKITYDFFSKLYGRDEKLNKFVNVVNAVDIWLEDKAEFELGKVCLGLVSGAKEINRIMFPKENSQYIFELLTKIQPYFDYEDPHIVLDENIHKIKKEILMQDKNDTLSNLISEYNVKMLNKNKEFMKIEYDGHLGILTYNIGNVSVIGNAFLKANPNFDFFMDVTSKKTISLRADGKIDVSKMAAKIANGGGHANASGGLLGGFKDGFVYEGIRSQIMNLITKKLGGKNAR
ncbi:DHH family phosphoesterase [Sulfurospirillum sp. 1612]|uniref:DHH family phosphoesterase n=1 Tax=Sulfurospirillum sp. 1612 TaxID=3094835 RepID=UPI002F92038E